MIQLNPKFPFKIISIAKGTSLIFKSIDNILYNTVIEKIPLNNLHNFHLYDYNDTIYIHDYESDKIFVVRDFAIHNTGYCGHYYYELKNGNILLSSEGNQKIVKFLKNEQTVWQEQYSGYVTAFNNNFIIIIPQYKSPVIEIRNIANFSFAFSFEIGNDFTVGKTLFIEKNILIIPFKKHNINYEARMVAVNLNTGKEIWNLETDSHEFLISEERNKIYAIYSSSPEEKIKLQSIEIDTGKLETTTLKSNSYRSIVPWNACISNDKLIYSDNVEGGKIGIIDLSTNEIIDECDLKLDEGVKLYNPYFFENKIYVLDTMKDVHVLEMCK